MADGIPMEPKAPKPPSRRAKQRARRAKAAAEGLCQGTNRRGGPCGKTPVEGRATCRHHGGNGGRPIVSGRYSEELPGRIAARVNASLNDPTLLDQSQTIAILDGLTREAAARAADLDTPAFRKRACELLANAIDLIAAEKPPLQALEPLGALLDRGLSEVIAQDRLYRMVERTDMRIADLTRTKLAKSNAVNAVDLVGVMQGLLAAVQRLCPADMAQQLVAEMERILGGIDAAPARETIVGRN